MSEETPQLEAEVESTPEQGSPEEKTFSEAYVKQLREEAASYRVKLKEFEDAQKSELERAQETAAEATARLAAVEAEAARLRIAAKHGIGEEHLDLLVGADEGELEAKAVKLAALIQSKPTDQPAPKKGAWAPFDLEEGKSPSGTAVDTSFVRGLFGKS